MAFCPQQTDAIFDTAKVFVTGRPRSSVAYFCSTLNKPAVNYWLPVLIGFLEYWPEDSFIRDGSEKLDKDLFLNLL